MSDEQGSRLDQKTQENILGKFQDQLTQKEHLRFLEPAAYATQLKQLTETIIKLRGGNVQEQGLIVATNDFGAIDIVVTSPVGSVISTPFGSASEFVGTPYFDAHTLRVNAKGNTVQIGTAQINSQESVTIKPLEELSYLHSLKLNKNTWFEACQKTERAIDILQGVLLKELGFDKFKVEMNGLPTDNQQALDIINTFIQACTNYPDALAGVSLKLKNDAGNLASLYPNLKKISAQKQNQISLVDLSRKQTGIFSSIPVESELIFRQ